MRQRPDNPNLNRFWPMGNATPIMFVDIVGEEGQDKTGSSKTETKVGVDSKYNMKEAELVVRSCCLSYKRFISIRHTFFPLQIEIAKTLHHQHGVKVGEIAVLSPYSAQKNKILEMVKKLPGELRKLRVASITESQGYYYLFLSNSLQPFLAVQVMSMG